MSARDEAVEMIRRICPAHLNAEQYGQILAEKFDAHRTEVLMEAANVADSTVALFEDGDEGAAAAGAVEGLAILFRRMAAGKPRVPQHFDKVSDPLDGCHWCACGNRWPCKDAPAAAPGGEVR